MNKVKQTQSDTLAMEVIQKAINELEGAWNELVEIKDMEGLDSILKEIAKLLKAVKKAEAKEKNK